MNTDPNTSSNGQGATGSGRTLLIFSQVYPPDPASVGQHMHDAAKEMASRGWNVRVIAADRGYDDPTRKYESGEVMDGVRVTRVPWASFGKATIAKRAIGMITFMLWCLGYGLFGKKPDFLLASTSPPLCGFAAAIIHTLRGVPFLYWVMDLNPDQLIALGKTKDGSPPVRFANWMQRFILKRAKVVVPLDRFMLERLNKKLDVTAKSEILPPWPHEDSLELVQHEDNWFRDKQNLQGKTVFMYSGNHGFSTPVDTMMDAAVKVAKDERAHFMFIGGGVRKKEVDERLEREKPANANTLPYQPMKDLRYSLSAADVHMVTMESEVVGIVHPCKIYGAMAVGRPILLLGPTPCHASDILEGEGVGWQVGPEDSEGAAKIVREVLETPREKLEEMGRTARRLVDEKYSKRSLCGRFCDLMER
ncbi:MAG: glycosyltransferase family 4 protein [Planctomycetota bacterium]